MLYPRSTRNSHFLEGKPSLYTAELVYGLTLRLPGEFISPTSSLSHESPADYVTKLKEDMQRITSISSHHYSQRSTYVNKALKTCTHVLVR